jgi:hypothetical protein
MDDAFWVVLATLTVLQSNVATTGATVAGHFPAAEVAGLLVSRAGRWRRVASD